MNTQIPQLPPDPAGAAGGAESGSRPAAPRIMLFNFAMSTYFVSSKPEVSFYLLGAVTK